MKKRWIAMGTTLTMMATMAIPAMAAINYETARLRPDFNIVIDGKEKNFKRADGSAAFALVYEDSTYLPLRAIGQIVDRTVEWDNDTKTVTLNSEGITVTDADTFSEKKDIVTDADTFKGMGIDLEEAKEIALKDAGLKAKDVTFVTAKVDYDDGRKYYDVEFYYNGAEYDYEISAENGRITDFDKDIEGKRPVVKEEPKQTNSEITAEEAKKIALKHAGLKESEVTRLKAEKDRDDGVLKYDVEFEKGRMEYDYEIHAETGKILKAEKDYDD